MSIYKVLKKQQREADVQSWRVATNQLTAKTQEVKCNSNYFHLFYLEISSNTSKTFHAFLFVCEKYLVILF